MIHSTSFVFLKIALGVTAASPRANTIWIGRALELCQPEYGRESSWPCTMKLTVAYEFQNTCHGVREQQPWLCGWLWKEDLRGVGLRIQQGWWLRAFIPWITYFLWMTGGGGMGTTTSSHFGSHRPVCHSVRIWHCAHSKITGVEILNQVQRVLKMIGGLPRGLIFIILNTSPFNQILFGLKFLALNGYFEIYLKFTWKNLDAGKIISGRIRWSDMDEFKDGTYSKKFLKYIIPWIVWNLYFQVKKWVELLHLNACIISHLLLVSWW